MQFGLDSRSFLADMLQYSTNRQFRVIELDKMRRTLFYSIFLSFHSLDLLQNPLLLINFNNILKMNKRQQQHFAAFFEQIYETQQILDFLKQKMAESRHYNPILLFDLISARSQKITINQMRSYLQDKVAVNERELYEIFERFDWTRQGFISKEDFIREILPFGKKLQLDEERKGTITAQIQGHFLSLIIEILKRFGIVEVARKQVKYIQPYDAFQYIDYFKTGHIGIVELRKLLFDNDFNVTDKQLYYLLHGLRRRCYRDVNLQCFCQNLNPFQFGEYVAYQFQIDKQKQKEIIIQNRREEQTVKRSRLQSQRIEHEFQKAERKKQAQIDRQIELQKKATLEIQKYEQQKQRQIRRAMMEQDKSIRHQLAAWQTSMRASILKNKQQKVENQQLNFRKEQQQSLHFALAESVFRRQQELQRSRRAIEQEKMRLFTLQRQNINEMTMRTQRCLQQSKKSMNQSNVKAEMFGKISNQSRKIQNQQSSRKNITDEMPGHQNTPQRFVTLKKKYEYDVSADIEDSKVFESSRTRQQTMRKIERQSRRIGLQSHRKYFETIIKQNSEKKDEDASHLDQNEILLTPLNESKIQKDYDQTKFQIKETRLMAEESTKSYR